MANPEASRFHGFFSGLPRGLHSGFLLGILLLLPNVANAHKLNVFASVEGNTIHGKAYFRGGSPVMNAAVHALDPAGREIAQTKTDDQGHFTFEAQYHCDYRLLVDTGDGHGGEFTVEAASLSDQLPQRIEGDLQTALTQKNAAQTNAAEGNPAPKQVTQIHVSAQDAKETASQLHALRAEITRLEEQLTTYEERTRWSDILGGIGYIVGISGAAYYYLGSRRKSTRP
jgi:nickel transport protein